VAGATVAGPSAAGDEGAGPVSVAGVQVAGPAAFAAAELGSALAALPATGQPVALIGAGFLGLAGAGALLRRRRNH
jgi:LPXTG-motif cell wall-anchored protein